MSCVFGIEQNCEECRMCEGKKRQTNADRIRSMTNKELAESRIDSIGMYSNRRTKNVEMWTGDFFGITNSKKRGVTFRVRMARKRGVGMSGDLISKSSLLEKMRKFVGNQRYLIPEEVWRMAENAHSAYDVDKIVEQIRENSFVPGDRIGVSDLKVIMSDKAVEIVKSGGLNG